MSATLEYGLDKDGNMRHISEVPNGLNCGCFCPNPFCSQRLIARNNPANIIALNFAHESGSECAGAKESELHRRAKDIICNQSHIILPDQSLYVYESAKPESTIDKYRADVSLTGGNYPLLVEIVVTCHITEDKTRFLQQSGKRTLVIDLCEQPRNIGQQELKKILVEDWGGKSMIVPLPIQSNSTTTNSWSIEKIFIPIILAVVAIYWTIPIFLKWLGDLISGKEKGKR